MLSSASHIPNITGEMLREEGEGCERDAALRLTAGVRGHIGTVKLLQLHSHTSPFENVTFLGCCEQFGVLSRKNSVVLMKLAGLG